MLGAMPVCKEWTYRRTHQPGSSPDVANPDPHGCLALRTGNEGSIEANVTPKEHKQPPHPSDVQGLLLPRGPAALRRAPLCAEPWLIETVHSVGLELHDEAETVAVVDPLRVCCRN